MFQQMLTEMFSSRNRSTLLWAFLFALVMYDILLRWSASPQQNCDGVPSHEMIRDDDPRMASARNEKEQLKMSKSGPTSLEKPCEVGTPCVYPEEVDLRVIVMTYNRASALSHVLASLEKLDAMGDTIALEIWIDRSKENTVHEGTLKVAQAFTWDKGPFRVHVQTAHAGIYGQWIDTWRPMENSRELSLLVEDDLLISPYTWRWLKAAHAHYGPRDDIAGYTLQSEGINAAGGANKAINAGKEDISFLYKVMGSWGFAPHPKIWREFQDWFQVKHADKSFHPYVNGIVMTSWYKSFEKKGTADGMWTMWFIYYCDELKYYTVYNNLNRVTGTSSHGMAVHRAEPGLHFHGKPRSDADKHLLVEWSPSYIEFPKDTKKYNYAGKAEGG